MKHAIFLVLALLMITLVALPLVPYGSTPQAVRPADACGDSPASRYVAGMGPAMPENGNGMMRRAGSAMPDFPGARHGREHPMECGFRQELRRDPFDGNATVRILRFRGYRRLSRTNILEHEKRQLIYSTILANPGIGITDLSSLTGINLHTLRYHLGYLIHLGKITGTGHGSGYHFFENHGRYGTEEQQRILYRRYPTTGRILALVDANPGITRGEIAADPGLAGPSVTRWTRRLIADGVVMAVRNGQRVRYYPVQETAGTAADPVCA